MDQTVPGRLEAVSASHKLDRHPPAELANHAPDPTATGWPSASPRIPRPGTARAARAGAGEYPPLHSRRHDGTGHRMLRRPLQPRCDPQHLIGRRSIGLDPGHVGCAGRERSSLVEGDHAHAGKLLHDLPAPDETASPREPPDPKRGRQGSRQPQPARARHDQHGEACEQRLVEGRPLRPEEHRETREDEHRGNERGRDPVRQALRMALLGQRLPHQAGDLRPTGRGAWAGAANEKCPVVIDAAGEHCGAGRLWLPAGSLP